MCTEFCICPGDPTATHYKQYQQIDVAVYTKFNRTFLAPDQLGEPDKSLKWTMGAPATSGNGTYASDTMLQCYDNSIAIATKIAQATGNSSSADEKKK